VLAAVVDFAITVPVAPIGDSKDFSTPAAAPSGFTALLADPVMWLCGLTLFFYAPLEACTSAWATTYLGEKGIAEAKAATLLSIFWLTFMAARLITAFTLPAGSEAALICVMAVVSVAVLGGFVVSRDSRTAAAMTVVAGFIYGPIFPTLIAVLFNHFEPSVRGRAVGLLFAIGGVGWTVVPMLIGAYARRTSVQRGFSIAIASAGGLTVVAALLWRVQ
jgi:fucose permease